MKKLTKVFFILSIILLFIISFSNPNINENFESNVNNTSIKPYKTVEELIKKNIKDDILHTKVKPDTDISDIYKYSNISESIDKSDIPKEQREQKEQKVKNDILKMKNSDIVPSHCEVKTKKFMFPIEIITRE